MIQGFLEAVDQFQVRGWAYETEYPEDCLRVEVSSNGASLGFAVANLYREDLERAGLGRGNHGFILNLERCLPDMDRAQIKAVAIGTTGQEWQLSVVVPAPRQLEESQPKLAFGGSTVDPSKVPVFILGAARSGTSAVTQALLSLPRFDGEQEGHALDLLAHFSVALNKFYDRKADELNRHTMVARLPQKYFDDAIDRIFLDLVAEYYKQTYWVEKTPNSDSIHLAPRFLKIWCNAKFIFMKRRGIENILSRQVKFPGCSFETHCNEWTSAMTAWCLVREQLSGAAIEVDQIHLAQYPRDAGARLGRFLGLDQREIDSVSQFFSSERPQRTGVNGAAVNPAEIGWDEGRWKSFEEICGESMRAFHYGFGRDYFASGASNEMFKLI
jgi:hypothetical protein